MKTKRHAGNIFAADWQDDDTPELALRLLGLPRLGDYTPEQMAEVFRCYPPEQTAEAVDWIRKQTPVYLGAGKIDFPSGAHPQIKLSESQTLAFEALLEAGGVADSAELASRSGREHAPRLLHYILGNNPALRPFFQFPGHKSKGGYSTSIQWDREKTGLR